MTYVSDPITIIPGTTNITFLNRADFIQALKVSNKSPYDINFSGFGVEGNDWMPAGTEYLLYGDNGNNGTFTMIPYNTAGITGSPPATVLLTQYLVDEKLPPGKWPISIPFQVQQVMGSPATSVLNTGNAINTPVVQGQPLGDSSLPLQLLNNGIAQLGDGTYNGLLEINNTNPQIVNPITGSGTISMYAPLGSGSGNPGSLAQPRVNNLYNKLFLFSNSFQNTSASTQVITLPGLFSFACFFIETSFPDVTFAYIDKNSVTHTLGSWFLSGVSSTGGSASNAVGAQPAGGWTFGYVNNITNSSPFNCMIIPASMASTSIGIMILEGY